MDQQPPQDLAAVRVIAMPADTNPSGDIFGGWLMCQMDLAASNVAARRAESRVATIAVDSMTFLKPVKVGDEVSVYAVLGRTGRTSLTIEVEAWRRPLHRNAAEKVTEAAFTFVAIGDDGRPTPLPEPSHSTPSNESGT
ncbi:acyl-CoA thioesterase [Sphingomonas crocodyli]|uniref:Acyl-CoA thioesterase n=2 Tax=Sphingomonas crocodyli TaxID=1979270 RepID=A0A437MBS6_9SPHN|nr:acyl-CoA thioesterase [Sphingomonas crocodyli]